jgi:hypothetical protein
MGGPENSGPVVVFDTILGKILKSAKTSGFGLGGLNADNDAQFFSPRILTCLPKGNGGPSMARRRKVRGMATYMLSNMGTLSTQCPHTPQWWALSGLMMEHSEQYRTSCWMDRIVQGRSLAITICSRASLALLADSMRSISSVVSWNLQRGDESGPGRSVGPKLTGPARSPGRR